MTLSPTTKSTEVTVPFGSYAHPVIFTVPLSFAFGAGDVIRPMASRFSTLSTLIVIGCSGEVVNRPLSSVTRI